MHPKKVILVVPKNSSFALPLKNGFEQLGYKTLIFDNRSLINNLTYLPCIIESFKSRAFSPAVLNFKFRRKIINSQLSALVRKIEPYLIFVVKGDNLISSTVSKLKKSKAKCIIWQVDPVFDKKIWPWFKNLAMYFDQILIAEEGTLKDLKKMKWGHKVKHMLAAADSTNMEKPEDVNKKFDLSFIGTYSAYREELLTSLKKKNMAIWGHGWENSSLSHNHRGVAKYKEIHNIYKRSKVVIGITQTNKISVNNRVFEVASAGGFIISSYNKYLSRIFKINEEIICFKNKKDLLTKVNYYLSHDEERLRIANKFYSRVKNEYTYKAKLGRLLNS